MTLADRAMAALEAAGIRSALIGASALAAYGVARSTFDIDLLAVDERSLEAATWRSLEQDGVAVEIHRGDPSDPLLGVVRLSADGQRPVDVIVGRSAWQARAVARARRLPGTAPIVQPRDLVLLKLYAGGTQDHWDIQQLLAACGDAPALAAEVDTDIADLPAEAASAWRALRPRA